MKAKQWLILMHQIPPKPDAARVKVWRSLQKIFALPIKNSVYALPFHENSLRSFLNIAREIRERGGDAILCEAKFIEGKSHEALEREYNDLLNQSFLDLSKGLRHLRSRAQKLKRGQDLMPVQHELGLVLSQLNDLSNRNFLGCDGEQVCRSVFDEISSRLTAVAGGPPQARKTPSDGKRRFRSRVWVTRKGIGYDRIASAWLIKKFIDPRAEFLFVDLKSYKKSASHVMFDLYGGDFTHIGDLCTFEVLLQRFKLKEPSLIELGKVIHDLDIQDARYEHPATGGVKAIFDGIIASTSDDLARLALGAKSLDHLEASFRIT